MGAQEFGALIEAERLKRGWTRSKLAVMVGVLDDGSALDATQIRRIIDGTRKLDQDIVRRLIRALDLDPGDAWEAALESMNLRPPGLTADMLRKLDANLLAVAGASKHLPGTVRSLRIVAGQSARATVAQPPEGDFDELISQLRPKLVLAVAA